MHNPQDAWRCDGPTPPFPESPQGANQMEAFEKDLTALINRHSIENVADVPDFILAGMICRMIEALGPSIKKTLDWHGCNSVCHPSPNKEGESAEDSNEPPA